MAMESIADQYRTQFNDMMHIKAQQKQARLRAWVKELEFKGEDMSYEGLGQVEAREMQGRFNLTVWDDLEHFRRQITSRAFVVTLPIDAADVEKRLTDPQGEYAAAVVRALERAYDKVVYQAAFASVRTGRSFATTVTASADGVTTINATAGFTYAKLLEIKKTFLDKEIGVDDDMPYGITISGDEHSTLLQIDQLINSRYTGTMKVDNGRIRTGVGAEFITFGAGVSFPLLSVSGGVRDLLALTRGAIAVGMQRNWEVEVDRRSEYVKVTQVQATGVLGGVRTEGPLLQKVQVTDQ